MTPRLFYRDRVSIKYHFKLETASAYRVDTREQDLRFKTGFMIILNFWQNILSTPMIMNGLYHR
jgi:hypothetical protein